MKERLEKIKKHLKENQAAYISGSVCLLVGIVVGAVTYKKISVSQSSSNVALLNYKPFTYMDQTTILELPARGHRGNAVVCNETGQIFASQREAAKALNLNPGNLSGHLSGKHDQVAGLTFKMLGENLSEKVALGN